MEWVETTAKTVEEAQDLALDKLGVDELEAEFEILEEPRPGLFGRMRGQARVRARVQPKAPRPKEDRNRRRRSSGGKKRSDSKKSDAASSEKAPKQQSEASAKTAATPDGGADRPAKRTSDRSNDRGGAAKKSGAKSRSRKPEQSTEESSMEEVSSCVEEFLSGLTTAFGLDARVVIDTTDGEINAKIEGKHGLLLGPKARTLDAIQELTRVAAQRTAPSSIRIKVDVGGYRAQRKASLEAFAVTAAERAIADGTEVVLEPMSSADRKAVHDRLGEFDGVSTRSAGNDPRRHVIIVPDAPAESSDDDVTDEADSEGDAS